MLNGDVLLGRQVGAELGLMNDNSLSVFSRVDTRRSFPAGKTNMRKHSLRSEMQRRFLDFEERLSGENGLEKTVVKHGATLGHMQKEAWLFRITSGGLLLKIVYDFVIKR